MLRPGPSGPGLFFEPTKGLDRMDATKLLETDHETVKQLFARYDAAGDDAFRTKQALFETIKGELLVHMDIEESIFYPNVKATPSEELKDDVREADEEHHVAKMLIGEISKMKPEDEQYDAKVTVLKENIEHHVEEEEGEMFPLVKKRLSKERASSVPDCLVGKSRLLIGSRPKLRGANE
jgi:iron-sulfur cluster repair protein YtfE (RIC family)